MITIVVLAVFINICHSSLDFRDKRDLSQLEYVVSVLEQQGRLHEVDSDLLKRINVALERDSSESVSEAVSEPKIKHDNVKSAKQSFLQRARERQLKLLGSRETTRNDRRIQNSRTNDNCLKLESSYKELELENTRLRKMIMKLEEELEMSHQELEQLQLEQLSVSARAINTNNNRNSFTNTNRNSFTNPLDKLLEAARDDDNDVAAADLGPGVIVSSSLVTLPPVTSTVFSTVR